MNIIDIGIVLLFLMFIVTGIKRGVIKEAVSLIAILLVFILSWQLKGIVGNILCIIFPFIDFNGIITMNILFYQFIAFLLVLFIMLGIYNVSLRISKALQKLVNMTIILIIPSKILGGIVSLIKGYLVVFIVFVLLMIPLGNSSVFKESKYLNFMLYKTPVLSSYTKDFLNSATEILDLSDKLTRKKLTPYEANLQTLDVMLKYKIVDKKTVESLIEVHKLDDVKDIDSVLSKY